MYGFIHRFYQADNAYRGEKEVAEIQTPLQLVIAHEHPLVDNLGIEFDKQG